MNIIWLTPEIPFPPNSGGRMGNFKRIEYLSKYHKIILLSIIDCEEERKYKNKLLEYCSDVFFYKRNKGIKACRKLYLPYSASSRTIKFMKRDIDNLCKNKNIDRIIIDLPQMMLNLPLWVRKQYKIVLNQHNIEHLALKSISKDFKGLKRLIYNVEVCRMKLFERSLYEKNFVNTYTFVSLEDKKIFEEKYKKYNTCLVPVGAEIHKKSISSENNIIFVGKMSYKPNEIGAKWFVENVWQSVLKKSPTAKLFLVGKEPTEEIKSYSEKDNIFVTGMVDSVDEYYLKAKVVILPLLSGGGVKVKLLEAMGYGKIIISTAKGIEGTDFENNKHILLAENAKDFAELCIKVLENNQSYQYIADNGYKEIVDNYSWSAIMDKFNLRLMEEQ